MSDLAPVNAITGTLPISEYVSLGVVHGHAESSIVSGSAIPALGAVPLSDLAHAAVTGMREYATSLGADLVIDVQVTFTSENNAAVTRVLATGTAARLRSHRLRDQYAHLIDRSSNPEELEA